MIRNYKTVFQKFGVTPQDEARYSAIISRATTFDEVEQVINLFMTDYVKRMNAGLTNLIADTLNIALSSELMNKELLNVENTFIFSSNAYENTLKANYAIIADLVSGGAADIIGSNPKVQKMITEKLITEFNARIQGAMANTRADVLNYTRKLQREMIIRNRQLMLMNKIGGMEGAIAQEKLLFEQNMLKKFPQLEKMLKDGRVFKSRTFLNSAGNETFRTYTLDDYSEMAISETLKNVDRDSVEFTAKYLNEPVVEFYLRDHRNVEEANPSCEHIMQSTLWGKPLLATSQNVANILQIWSIDRAKAEHSLEISRHCRHSIKRASDEVINKVNKLVNIAGLTDQVYPVEV
jgi:hypothetical protein